MSEYQLESGKGGSIANVAYNPCGVNSTSQMLAKEVVRNIFVNGESCLGRAVFAAKCSVIARHPTEDTIYGPAVLWTLFGDPALRVRHRILTGVEERPTPYAPRPTLGITPNPCRRSAVLHVTTGPLDHSTTLAVYDASGRLVLSQPVRASSFILRTSSLSAGVYVVELSTGCSPVLRQKLVVR